MFFSEVLFSSFKNRFGIQFEFLPGLCQFKGFSELIIINYVIGFFCQKPCRYIFNALRNKHNRLSIANQTTPNGFYNIERMLRLAITKGTHVKICGSCAEARGLKHAPLIEGAEISNMAELTNWVVDSDKVLTF